MVKSFVERAIERLELKDRTVGLSEDEHISLQEYKGRMLSIEYETDYLNGEVYES